jgi:hypothetical protein
MPVKKSDTVREMVSGGRYKEALRIAKDFRLGISKEEHDAMERGYDCLMYPDFYRGLGFDPEEEVLVGIAVIVKLYGGKKI